MLRIALVSLLLALSVRVAAEEADLIFHNGKVLAVDEKFSQHEALAVRGERVGTLVT